ncbi:response regulator [Flavisolibacter ginsengisoli]|jgi:two-component system KDP operon response regulator KdpE|uniref:Two-component system, OmpR family, KDP operon response regulator KdpE n=1 Tax=Flavisolibacter ginsengisoli DSM 18119 TaxID=1121884 RepID=A0A1M4SQY0_9BACT|nr:response regulator [Flavisolibacter ginsengisoli]SHE34598.1 two-component system, OmpR family, KDP operon response regulator KdpE [Flavisolibacter ginsengisoli DSM 18119]
MNRQEILVIDDEPQIRKLLEITLQTNNYVVRQASNAKEGLIMAGNHPPELILLDLGLPDESGHSVLQKLRKWYTNPVIILSVQKNEEDIIRALDNGANDYLSKPFRAGELLARIRSALRSSSMDEGESLIDFTDIKIDLTNRMVKKKGEVLKLTNTEYSLLALLMRNEGKVLTHQFLLRAIWGPGYIHQSQYLRVFVAQLRKKIEDDPNRPVYLLTESGVGYRFVGSANKTVS